MADDIPPQEQEEPGKELDMTPKPKSENPDYKPSGKFEGKAVIVTGGDSGIGKSVAIHFALEGADISIVYNKSDDDANTTKERIEEIGRKCILIKGDVGDKSFCDKVVKQTLDELGRLDVLVNNAGEQHPQEDISKIPEEQLRKTFQTNIFSMFFMTQAALPYLNEGSSILNNTSITAYKGNEMLIDYSSTKGAITSFTRSLGQSLAKKGIRVNAVAPGPIWTPLIPSTFPPEKTKEFGKDTPMGRAGEPYEVAAAFIFLASPEASYITSQTIHVNGGYAVNG